MQRPPVSDTSLLERKMSADSTRSGEGRSSRVSTDHAYDAYRVFLSFGGSNSRKGIADHLYTRLVDTGSTAPIFVFTMGSQFSSQLLDPIVWSKVSIPILSENYAATKWFLRELFQKVENGKSTGRGVMPIFDGVEPSHVRNLRGSFQEAFRSHKMCFEQRTAEAGQQELRDISFLKGWESEKITNGYQREFVRIVVEMVLSELTQGFQVDVPDTLAGMDDPVKKIIGLLETSSNDSRTIGIYDMGGIGKTTIPWVNCASPASFQIFVKQYKILLDDVDNKHQLDALAT